jgi:hypothetical protein
VSEHDLRDDYDDEPWRKRPKAETLVQWPASIISTIGLIQLAFSILSVVWMAGVVVWNWIDPAFFNNELVWYEVLAGIGAAALCVALNWFILRGARALRSFRSYRSAVTGVVLFFFSLPFFYCGLVTLPVGVWAFVVLLQPDVRARFEAVARGTIQTTQSEDRNARTDSAP